MNLHGCTDLNATCTMLIYVRVKHAVTKGWHVFKGILLVMIEVVKQTGVWLLLSSEHKLSWFLRVQFIVPH